MQGSKAAPLTFLLGPGMLVVGLIAHAGFLDVMGGCLIGAVIVGAILDKY